MQGLRSHREDLGYTLREWAEEEGDLTKVLTGALWWWSQGGEAMGGRGWALGHQVRGDSAAPAG